MAAAMRHRTRYRECQGPRIASISGHHSRNFWRLLWRILLAKTLHRFRGSLRHCIPFCGFMARRCGMRLAIKNYIHFVALFITRAKSVISGERRLWVILFWKAWQRVLVGVKHDSLTSDNWSSAKGRIQPIYTLSWAQVKDPFSLDHILFANVVFSHPSPLCCTSSKSTTAPGGSQRTAAKLCFLGW